MKRFFVLIKLRAKFLTSLIDVLPNFKLRFDRIFFIIMIFLTKYDLDPEEMKWWHLKRESNRFKFFWNVSPCLLQQPPALSSVTSLGSGFVLQATSKCQTGFSFPDVTWRSIQHEKQDLTLIGPLSNALLVGLSYSGDFHLERSWLGGSDTLMQPVSKFQ